MRLPRTILTFTVLAVLVLAVSHPWGLGSDFGTAPLLLPFAGLAYVTLRAPAATGAWVAFAFGLALDVLSHGPLGYWSLLYIAGWIAVRRAQALYRGDGALQRWGLFAVVAAMVAALAWLVASLVQVRIPPGLPFVYAAMIAVAAYPVLALLLGGVVPHGAATRALQLERRG